MNVLPASLMPSIGLSRHHKSSYLHARNTDGADTSAGGRRTSTYAGGGTGAGRRTSMIFGRRRRDGSMSARGSVGKTTLTDSNSSTGKEAAEAAAPSLHLGMPEVGEI